MSLYLVHLITVIDVETWHRSWKWMIAKGTPSFRSSTFNPLSFCVVVSYIGRIAPARAIPHLAFVFLLQYSCPLSLCCICGFSLLYSHSTLHPLLCFSVPQTIHSSFYFIHISHCSIFSSLF